MVAHEKRNPAQLFCAVPTQNDLALSSLLFSDHPTQKLEYPGERICQVLCGDRFKPPHRARTSPSFQRKVLVPHPIFTYNAVQDKAGKGV